MTTRRIAVAGALVLALAGCTGDAEVDETPTVALTETLPSPTPTETVAPSPVPSPTTSPTPSPTPSPSPTIDTSPGSLANPLAIGDGLELAGWTIVVEDFTGNATEAVAEALSVNPAPENGQYALVELAVTNTGDEAADPGFALTVVLIAADGTEYPDTACAAVPEDALTLATELDPGDDTTGTFCFDVPEGAPDGAVLSFEETLALDAPRLHVALG